MFLRSDFGYRNTFSSDLKFALRASVHEAVDVIVVGKESLWEGGLDLKREVIDSDQKEDDTKYLSLGDTYFDIVRGR